jgi:hypothetical protein
LVANYESMLDSRKTAYDRRLKEYRSIEIKIFIQLSKKWKHLTTTLTSERGVWRANQGKNQKKIYKVNKFLDSSSRRMLLKLAKNSEAREYLSLSMHKEKLRKQKENGNTPLASMEASKYNNK